MNSRLPLVTLLLILTSGVAFAYPVQLCDNGGFETGDYVLADYPLTFPYPWHGDICMFVTSENGIVPYEGQRMLKYWRTGLVDWATEGKSEPSCNFDLQPYVDTIASGLARLDVSAYFDNIAGALVDDQYSIQLRFYDENKLLIGALNAPSLFADYEPATWEKLNAFTCCPIPTNARFMRVCVYARQNVWSGDSDPFPGNYVDNVSVILDAAPPPDHFCGMTNATAKSLDAPFMNPRFEYKVWGKVAVLGNGEFTLDDGSRAPVTVVGPGYAGVVNGDYASASGWFEGQGELRRMVGGLSPLLRHNTDYLTNSGFEAGTLSPWVSYGVVDGVQSGSWYGSITAHTGNCFFGTASCGGTKNGALYQRVAVADGDYLAKAWSCVYWLDNGEMSTQNKVGIDPTGGTNPGSASVVWSAIDTQPASGAWAWEELTTPSVHCESGYVTVFLRAFEQNTTGWHINCFDDVSICRP